MGVLSGRVKESCNSGPWSHPLCVLPRWASRGRCCTALAAPRRDREPGCPRGRSPAQCPHPGLAGEDPVYTWTLKKVLTQRLKTSVRVPEWTSEGLDEDPPEGEHPVREVAPPISSPALLHQGLKCTGSFPPQGTRLARGHTLYLHPLVGFCETVPHFTGGKSEAQGGEAISPKPQPASGGFQMHACCVTPALNQGAASCSRLTRGE